MTKNKIKLRDLEKNYIYGWALDFATMLEMNPDDLTKEEWDEEVEIANNIIAWCGENDK